VAIGGGACVIQAVYFSNRLPSLRDSVRPIYQKMGILPEIASGLGMADSLRDQP
jgi:hypothetical protein